MEGITVLFSVTRSVTRYSNPSNPTFLSEGTVNCSPVSVTETLSRTRNISFWFRAIPSQCTLTHKLVAQRSYHNGSFQMEILTDENINPAFKRVKYGIRGWLEDRTHEIRQELARVSVTVTIKKFRGGGNFYIAMALSECTSYVLWVKNSYFGTS